MNISITSTFPKDLRKHPRIHTWKVKPKVRTIQVPWTDLVNPFSLYGKGTVKRKVTRFHWEEANLMERIYG